MSPDSHDWVDHIRKMGNEATHEIAQMDKDLAEELLEFTAMMLKFMFELPNQMAARRKQQNSKKP